MQQRQQQQQEQQQQQQQHPRHHHLPPLQQHLQLRLQLQCTTTNPWARIHT
jgi:hypothetical protein